MRVIAICVALLLAGCGSSRLPDLPQAKVDKKAPPADRSSCPVPSRVRAALATTRAPAPGKGATEAQIESHFRLLVTEIDIKIAALQEAVEQLGRCYRH